MFPQKEISFKEMFCINTLKVKGGYWLKKKSTVLQKNKTKTNKQKKEGFNFLVKRRSCSFKYQPVTHQHLLTHLLRAT